MGTGGRLRTGAQLGTGGTLAARCGSLDEIAEALPQRAAALSRVFLAHTSVPISRTETGVLSALSRRPRRITELAAREGVTQPAITRLVDRLQLRGWVAREADPADGRVVLVTLTEQGRATLDQVRAEYRATMHEEMASLPERDVRALADAIEILDRLIERLTGEAP
ncbi:MAG: MarR family winged helix-turn-helix transcriptional regulator [Solirubrobacteraceae bacterium]